MELSYFKGKKVLVTGHTGFKGSWLSRILMLAGAEVSGYSLAPAEDQPLFGMLGLGRDMNSVSGDIRDFEKLHAFVREVKPDVVLHLAAQPIVRESYAIPRYTYEVNVMGTVNLLDSLRLEGFSGSLVNVTTDKVYLNREVMKGFVEDDPLDGYDPYSNSKSCSELVTHSYRSSFFNELGAAVSTARAGNVIGGGDMAKDRLIPDCVRASMRGEPVIVRNPDSVRPFQHVLESLSAYLLIAMKQAEDSSFAGAYNIGPDLCDAVTVKTVTDMFVSAWGDGAEVVVRSDGGPHEAKLLMLDCTKIKDTLGWSGRWNVRKAVEKTAEWSKAVFEGGQDAGEYTDSQIREYFDV
ncbi:MAG: CDP-glucose 4,6-dehydratase [Lachnospiraceae bacterium]|nr:CDP-glucose 4,6-dehydratase [Lachnospiraceae bacterium]